MSALDDFLGYAEEEIDYQEGPNNDNKFGEYFGHNNVSWCAYFISWCADQAGILTDNEIASYPYMPNTGSVGEYIDFYKKNSRSLEPKMDPSSNNYPIPGDLVTITPKNKPKESHIGIVYQVNGDKITTIEGNCSDSVRTATYTNLNSTSFGKIERLLSNHKSY